MMLLGMIWAALAPLLLVLAIALVRRLLQARLGTRLGPGQVLIAAAGLVLLPVAAVWGWQRSEFQAVCRGEGAAVIDAKAKADGFLLASSTANSFGTRYLYDDGFSWFEARDIYRRDGWVRYERDAAGAIKTTPIDKPTARYEVGESHSRPLGHTSLMTTTVRDRETGRLLARASSAHFDGGATKWVLGAWGNASCPNPMWDSGGFRRFYNLARDTLR